MITYLSNLAGTFFSRIAITKCRRWYSLLIALVCILLWYYILNTQSTSRNPVVVSAVQQHVRLESINDTTPNRITEKYLVFLCDERKHCGGWGDRQRGMVTLFILSLAWKRKFRIISTTPCDIKPYYQPTKEYNWTFTEDELKELKGKRTNTIYFSLISPKPEKEPFLYLNMNSSEVAEVLYIRTNCFHFLGLAVKYKKFLPAYLHNKGRAGVFRESWNRFMIPTNRLISQVVQSSGKINLDAKKSGKELVCAHLRVGRSKYLPYDYLGIPLASIPKVWEFIDGHFPNTSRIFIATDHPDVRKSALNEFGSRYIGSYAHVMSPDQQRSNLTLACSSQESAYVDQMMLSRCDVLIYYGRSGFSIHASYLKTNWNNIYSIIKNGSSTFSLKKINY